MTGFLGADALFDLPRVAPEATLRYATDAAQQFGHLYLPETAGPHPVVVLLHGGCWRAKFTLDYLGQAARALCKRGVAVWNLEYRCIGNGGGWPDTFLDVARGTDFLRSIASDYQLDLSRVLAMGHSAGGHLASWLALREHLPMSSRLYLTEPLAIHAVLSIAGIPDLAEALRQGICADQAPAALLGGLPHEVPQRYQQGSPRELPPSRARQVFIQGQQDEVVPLAYSQDYVAKAKARGEDIELIVLGSSGHIEPVVATTWQWQRVEDYVREWLEQG